MNQRIGHWHVVVAEDDIYIAPAQGGADDMIAYVSEGDGRMEIAHLICVAPELLSELKLANQIIINALNTMTPEQKQAWDELNTRDGLKDGWALTRNTVREAIIARAEGRKR